MPCVSIAVPDYTDQRLTALTTDAAIVFLRTCTRSSAGYVPACCGSVAACFMQGVVDNSVLAYRTPCFMQLTLYGGVSRPAAVASAAR